MTTRAIENLFSDKELKKISLLYQEQCPNCNQKRHFLSSVYYPLENQFHIFCWILPDPKEEEVCLTLAQPCLHLYPQTESSLKNEALIRANSFLKEKHNDQR